MADVQSNIHVNIDTSDALASLKLLQRQISAFHTQMSKSGAAASAVAANQAQNLMNSINATGQFQASMRTVATSTEHFTNALERNKLTSREYFRYTGAATKTFGRLFKSEFETINKVARERVKDIQTQYIKMGRGANGALQAIAVRPLTLDMKNLATQTAMAAQRQQLLNQLLKQGSTNLLNFGKNTQWAGRQLMVGFTVPLMLLGSTAAKTFMKLEEQAIRFKRVYGEMFTTKEETDKMVSDIQLLAKEFTKYGVAVEKTMEMAANAAAMGKVGEELKAQVMEATRLAVLGGVEQEQALETTISVTNAFGVAAEDLAGKIDFLNAVENQTVVSIEDLTIAIPKAGPVVRQLGGDVQDLAFFLTAMKEGGINASEGANALKSGLASLINPSEKASKMLAGLGVNIKGIVEANAGDVKGTVIDFASALDTLDPLNRARAIEQLFGKFQFSRLSTLFQNVTKQGTQASRVLELTKATTEELAILSERELSRIEDSTTYRFKKTIEDLKVSLAPVGEQFLKALTPIVEFVSKVLEKFNGLGDGSKRFITILTVALGAIGPVALMTFGLLANGVANIIKLFAAMKSSFNRAGSSTQILGQQTDYLTKEQMEASAVAASLDQVHQRLRQTFTSETAAVNALALAYRNAIAAQVGFTGPVGRAGKAGKGQSQSLKYGKGTKKVPGRTSAGDVVPALLTGGEAVIPAQAAQDPANRPVIASLVEQGTATPKNKKVRPKPETVFAHATKAEKMQTSSLSSEFDDVKRNLAARGIEQARGYRGLGFDIPGEMNSRLDKSSVDVREYEREIRKPRAVETMTSRLMKENGLSAAEAEKVANKVRKNLILSLQGLPDGTPINDRTIYSRMGNLKTGILGGLARDPKYADAVKQIYKVVGVGPGSSSVMKYGSKMAVEDVIKNIRAHTPATNPATIKALEQIALKQPGMMLDVNKNGNVVTSYERLELHNKKQFPNNPEKWTWSDKKVNAARQIDPKTGNPIMKPGRSRGDTGAVKVGGTAGKKMLEQARAVLQGLTAKDIDGRPVTTYAKQLEKGTGYSNVAARDASGIFLTEDGKKVYVKPMPDLRAALAEQRATEIARSVHDLEAPRQELRVIKDPYTGKTMFALESVYDSKFTPKELSSNFSRQEYFKQLVAANLRGDSDLKKGNLGGNRVVDVGRAGVLDKASGARGYAERMPSMLEMAEKNLSGVKGPTAGGSPFWFGNATADIVKKMTPDEYHKAMIAEIDKTLPKLKETISKFNLGPEDKKYYQAMIDRLEEGKKVNWRLMHAKHNAILVKPDELIEDEKTKKLEKPKTRRKTKGVKSGSSKDTREMNKPPKGKRVVQGPRGVKVPGFSEAPMSSQEVKQRIAKEHSQAKAAASRTALYGSGPIDAEQKSLRRHLKKLEGNGKTLNNVAAKVAVTQKVVTDNMTENVKKQGVAARMQEKLKTKYNASKEAKAAAKAAGTAKPGIGMGGAAMGVAGVAMVGSMIPGSVGEMFQKLMMPLMGLAMILPMLGSKMGVVAVAAMAVVGAIAKLRMEFDKAQDEAIKLSTTMGSGKDAIRSYAKFAGNVTAGEIMERRSKEKFGMLGAKPGKTTFGESFVQGETGKALMASTNTRLKEGDQKGATQDLTNQLMTSILSGAIDSAQAKSIALNIGQKVGNYGLGFAVTANINKIIGPNGENLEKDPLQIRVNLINEKTTQTNNLFDQMQGKSGLGTVGLGALSPKAGIGATAGAGALAGAGLGAAAGSAGGIFAPITVPAGMLVGAGIGAVAGAVGGYFSQKDSNKKTASMSGAVVGSQRAQLEQQQELTDSLDLYYQKKLKELEVQGDIVKLGEEQIKYDEAKAALAEKAKATNESILSQYGQTKGNVRSAMDTGVDKMLTQRYKGTDEVQYLDASKTLLADSGLTKEQQYLIKVKMSTGELTPSQQVFLFSNFGDNEEVKEQYMKIITDFSARTGDEATRVMSMFSNPDGTPNTKLQAEFIGNVSTKTSDAEASKYIGFFAEVANTGGVFDMTAALNYYIANPEVAEKTQGIIDNIEKNKGKLTLDVMTNFLPENVMGQIDTDYFNKLSQDERLTYLKEIATIVNIPDAVIEADPDFKKWLDEGALYNGDTYKDKSIGEQIFAYRQFQPYKVTQAAIEQAATLDPGKGKGNGKGPDASPLDDLLKKLRDVRKNSIKVTKGFDASFKSLNNIFGGKKTIEVFSGIENDMRRLGAGEDLIDLIVGMDPEEFEKQKNKLFKIENGEIVKIKDGAKSIGDALQSIALGDFVSTQDRMVKNIGNQNAALKRLQAAGVEGSLALDMVANSSTAAAIANSKLSDKQLQKVIKAANKSEKALRKMAAVEAVQGDIKDLDRRSELYDKIIKNVGQYNQAEIEAILNSPALTEGLLTGAANFAEGLKKELEKKKIELKIKTLTLDGMQEIFDTGVSNAMEAFDVQETQLRLDFNVQNKPLTDAIKKAEEQIALAQEKIRIEEIGLKEIEDQEEKVNEKYDKRLEALDEVEKANASISQQQKGQLTLAEALTSGDIAAAARAAQEMRAQQAADAVTKQKEALEQSREYELSQLRSIDGRSRIEIEKEIKKLQDEIYEIEIKSLHPNRETLRLNELALEKAIEGLTVLGKTREQWEQIKNAVDLARIASADFIKSMQDALNIQQKLINAYQTQKVSTDPIIPEKAIVCPTGYKLVGDKCIKEGTTETVCPTGYKLVGENCVKEGNIIDNSTAETPAEIARREAVARMNPSALAAQESGAIGAASIARQVAAYDQMIKIQNSYAQHQAKERAEAAAASAATAAANSGGPGFFDRFRAKGGLIDPVKFAKGGFAKGTDTVPAMLTPGEFIMSKYAVDSYGLDNMKKINNGESIGGSVYNNTYTLTVNAKTNANPNEIAQAVMSTIKQVDDRRIRGVALNGRR
jgi:TP901 family phage tail tape measure protein